MKKIAVFASGHGSNFKNLLTHPKLCKKYAEIVCLICNKENIGALKIAESYRIPVHIIPSDTIANEEVYSAELLSVLHRYRPEWLVLAGFLKKIPPKVVAQYPNRIINIHPALLPAFGGKGMYGMHVHQAVFESGAKVSGATVHLVDNNYDRGPIVFQECVDISRCHSAEEIAAAVLKKEHILFSNAIIALLTKEYQIKQNRVNFTEYKNDSN